MNNRLRLVLILGTLILLSMTMVACSRERPASTTNTGTPAARGTVAALTVVAPAITQVALPTAVGGGANSTPSAPSAQQVVVSPAAPGSGQTSNYTVVAGDTLLSIATRFGTTTEALAQLNGLPDPNALTLGQKLLIPGAGATTGASQGTGAATTGGSTSYTVQRGDTVGTIARRFGTTVQEIVRLNNLTNPNNISVGQKLTVPSSGGAVAAPTRGQGKTYVIQRGDTLLSIARRFGLTVKQLQDANNISNPDRIYPGQTVVIP